QSHRDARHPEMTRHRPAHIAAVAGTGRAAEAPGDDHDTLLGGCWRNHSTIFGMSRSKPPGTETFSTPARSGLRFSKSCVMPAGARTNEPAGASTQRSPS